jgi:nucleoside-diphosphate-sugar epimerase
MVQIDKSKPVMVTGATGYVAGWLVKKLLDEGLTVNAAVRNPNDKNKTSHLFALADESTGKINFFKSDLLIEGSYAEAMKGCELVYHTASPFTSNVENPQKALIEPALYGTRNVLEQANKTESVKRVVLTSSCAAIYGDNIDLKETPNGIFTEETWNSTSSIDYQAYSYSKLLAEKEAWKISEKQSRWDLVVVNPSFVLGPALNPKTNTSESFSILRQMADGTFKSGVPDIGMGVVDVRDVADIHFKAGFTPEAKGRNIASGHNSSFLEMAKILHKKYGEEYKIPDKALPKWLLMLVGPMVNKTLTRKYIRRNVNLPFKADNTKSIKSLGATYRPLEETLTDSLQELIEDNII